MDDSSRRDDPPAESGDDAPGQTASGADGRRRRPMPPNPGCGGNYRAVSLPPADVFGAVKGAGLPLPLSGARPLSIGSPGDASQLRPGKARSARVRLAQADDEPITRVSWDGDLALWPASGFACLLETGPSQFDHLTFEFHKAAVSISLEKAIQACEQAYVIRQVSKGGRSTCRGVLVVSGRRRGTLDWFTDRRGGYRLKLHERLEFVPYAPGLLSRSPRCHTRQPFVVVECKAPMP